MALGTVVAFDGSWSHRKRAKEYVVVLIDLKQKRLLTMRSLSRSSQDLQSILKALETERRLNS